MSVDLDKILGPGAGTAMGPLSPLTRRNLQAVLDCPCEHHWDEAAHCIVNPSGQTLWQAVIAVDRISGWSQTPDEPTLLAALLAATK